MDQKEISKFKNLNVLICNGCELITGVNHLSKTLEILHCGGNCGIDGIGISKLRTLKKIYRGSNSKLDLVEIPPDIIEIKQDCYRDIIDEECIEVSHGYFFQYHEYPLFFHYPIQNLIQI